MFSIMKCLFTVTYLVFSWYIGLWTMFIIALLLEYNLIGVLVDILYFCRSLLSHKNSQVPSVNALNSASTLCLETIDCFLLFHVIKQPPTKVQYLEVDLFSLTDLTQLASVNASTLIWSLFLNNNPFLGVFFRYLRILYTTWKCSSWGECITWLTTLTANAKSSYLAS